MTETKSKVERPICKLLQLCVSGKVSYVGGQSIEDDPVDGWETISVRFNDCSLVVECITIVWDESRFSDFSN